MALEAQQKLGGNGSDAAAPLFSLDGDLVNRYLELQVSWLTLQMEAARQAAAASGDDQAIATTTTRLWREAAPTAAIVLLVGGAVGLLSALNWSDVWRGLSYGQPNLVFLTDQTVAVSGQVRAAAAFMQEWKDVLLSIAGGGALLGFKRLAYRSVRSALVIALALILGLSMLAGLVLADIHLVDNALTPVHVTWRGWAALAVALVAAVVLYNELCDIANSSPEAFRPRSQRSGGFARWLSYFTTATGLGRFLEWLATPRGIWRWLASIGVVTAASIVLCLPILVTVIATDSYDSGSWGIAFVLTMPLGPLWWLLLLGVVASSSTARHPAQQPLSFAIFAAVPALSLVTFIAILLNPGGYDALGSIGQGFAVLAALAFEAWVFWFLWAGIALSTPLRIVFLPVVLLCAATVQMYFGLLPFLGLVGILTVGVPWALWRSRPVLLAA